jgi:hypothetical protein
MRLGLLAGLVGISCCVTPTVLALLGLASASAAVSLGNTLYYQYGWWFRGAAVLLAGVGIVRMLRARRACSLRGAATHWRLLLTTALVMTAVYVFLAWLTTELARGLGA